MYGMVNRAVEGLVCERFGREAWVQICRDAGVTEAPFVSMQAYDDAITYRLVGAASARLGSSPSDLLEAFGEYWTLYVAKAGYGDMLGLYGDTIEEFLGNLDTMHAQVAVSMPELVPPSFEVESVDSGRFLVHYRSNRAGLAPMVVGLLRGVGKMLGQPVEVSQVASVGEGADHDIFDVRRI